MHVTKSAQKIVLIYVSLIILFQEDIDTSLKMPRSWKLDLIWGGPERYLHLIINAGPRFDSLEAELTYGADQ